VRVQVEEIIGQGPGSPAGHIPFTPQAKKVLELSLREALALGHHHIGTGHLLLGLLREAEGVAAQALVRLGTGHAPVRERVLELLGGECGQADPQTQLAEDLVQAAEQLTRYGRRKRPPSTPGISTEPPRCATGNGGCSPTRHGWSNS